jgi:hypothetical protein
MKPRSWPPNVPFNLLEWSSKYLPSGQVNVFRTDPRTDIVTHVGLGHTMNEAFADADITEDFADFLGVM